MCHSDVLVITQKKLQLNLTANTADEVTTVKGTIAHTSFVVTKNQDGNITVTANGEKLYTLAEAQAEIEAKAQTEKAEDEAQDGRVPTDPAIKYAVHEALDTRD